MIKLRKKFYFALILIALLVLFSFAVVGENSTFSEDNTAHIPIESIEENLDVNTSISNMKQVENISKEQLELGKIAILGGGKEEGIHNENLSEIVQENKTSNQSEIQEEKLQQIAEQNSEQQTSGNGAQDIQIEVNLSSLQTTEYLEKIIDKKDNNSEYINIENVDYFRDNAASILLDTTNNSTNIKTAQNEIKKENN
jgi:hypothetical protein